MANFHAYVSVQKDFLGRTKDPMRWNLQAAKPKPCAKYITPRFSFYNRYFQYKLLSVMRALGIPPLLHPCFKRPTV